MDPAHPHFQRPGESPALGLELVMSDVQFYTPLLDRMDQERRSLPTIILHYDPDVRDLRVWFWPITSSGQRVTPSDLWEYRYAHQFKTPCCLCACTLGGTYTESIIYRALDGPYAGEFICGCASFRCGFLVEIERMYSRRGLLVDRYPARGVTALGSAISLPIETNPPHIHPPAEDNVSIPMYERPVKAADSIWSRLIKLNSSHTPGLTAAEFRMLFAKCRCGLVMTKRVFRNHTCQVVIDLTGDDNAENSASIPIIIDLTGDSEDDIE